MDEPDFPAGKPPRRHLQGPGQAPLKVSKESHKIKKRSSVVPPSPLPQSPPPPSPSQPPRPPVIIYTVPPRVIHTHPNDFKELVQRLTGMTPSSSSSSSAAATSSSSLPAEKADAISRAARFASTERTRPPKMNVPQIGDFGWVQGMDTTAGMGRSNFFPGVLSPAPAALPPVPPNFFPPPVSPNFFPPPVTPNFFPPAPVLPNLFPPPVEPYFFPPAPPYSNPESFYQDLSPFLQSNRNYMEGNNFMPSPSNFLPPHSTSPAPSSLDLSNNPSSLDLSNNLFDF